MMGLTKVQSDTLAFIRSYMAANDMAPNFSEIMGGVGLASKSNVHRILGRLEDRGHIRRLHHRARAIELVSMDEAAMYATVRHMSGEERRRFIAIIAGLQADADGDGGYEMGLALRRISDRLTGQPRRAVA